MYLTDTINLTNMNKNEDIEEIFAFLGTIRPLSAECKAYLRKVIQYKELKKNDVLLRIGEVDKHLYFIKRGSLECFHYHKDKEIYDWFFFQTATVVSTRSFYNQVPSEQCIQAGVDTEVYFISWQDFEYLILHFVEFGYVATRLLEKYIVNFEFYAMLIRDKKTGEKIQELIDLMPELLQLVEAKKIATWLNMHPSTLSRMKKALNAKKPVTKRRGPTRAGGVRK